MAELKDLGSLTVSTDTWLLGQNANGSGGKFAVSSLVTMYAGAHVHSQYAPLNHNHAGIYAAALHIHSGYAAIDHTHNGQYATAGHTHNNYAAANHNHDTSYGPTITATVVKRNTTQNIATATWTKLNFNSADENGLGAFVATVPGMLTVPTAGWYLIQADWAIPAATAQLALVKNNASPTLPTDATLLGPTGQFSRGYALDADDELTVYAYQETGSDVDVGAAVPYRAVVSLARVA